MAPEGAAGARWGFCDCLQTTAIAEYSPKPDTTRVTQFGGLKADENSNFSQPPSATRSRSTYADGE